MADKEWCDSSCAACSGQGSRPGADGFVACVSCEGTGKIKTRGGCCARGEHHHHGDASRTGEKACDERVTLEEMMAELDLENARGEPVAAAEAFDNKVVGLYFTGKHCPACVRFSPVLSAFSAEERAGYVTVVVSGDGSADAADAGFAGIVEGETAATAGHGTDSLSPTLRVPFDSPHRQALLRAFRVFAIPALHVWHPAAKKSVTAWGHTAISFNRSRCVAQWHKGQAGWEVGVFDWLNPLPQCVSLASFTPPPGAERRRSDEDARDDERETRTTAPTMAA